jgi:hypothetical protein
MATDGGCKGVTDHAAIVPPHRQPSLQAHKDVSGVKTFLYECGTSKADSMADRLKGEA